MTESANPTPGAGPDSIFHSYLKCGEFMLQQCSSCERHIFPPRLMCPHCGSISLAWTKPTGDGEVYSVSIVRQRPDKGGDYAIALIDLHEGVRMMGHVVDMEPKGVWIGLKVSASVGQIGEQAAIVFRKV